MRKLLFTTMLSVSIMIFSAFTANARLASTSDLWDVSQGTVVTDSSGALTGSWSSDPRNMFGGKYGSGPADLTNNTIFKDYQSAGYVHWVNWQTSAPITLQSFNLVAIHDYGQNPYEFRDINYRGISRFKLFWGAGSSGPWTLLYDYTVNPVQDSGGHNVYGGGANYTGLNYLELFANVPLTTAQYFRAEFYQYGSGSSSYGDAQGPRIYELDGYGPDPTDDFNDGIKDPAKWGTDEVKGHGQLNETSGRLEYTCGSGKGVSSSDRPWKLTRFPYDAPWEVIIEATNTTSPTGNQWSSFGIAVENAKNGDDWIEVELAAQDQFYMFWAEFHDNNTYVGDAVAGTISTSAPIRVSFDNVTKVFTVSYFDGAFWNSFGTFGVNGSGGINGNANWGLTDSDQFIAYIFGYSENMTVNDGEMYGDNFQETGGVPPPPTELSVPEGTFGTQITITGSGFGDKKGKVLIGGLKLKIATWTDTSITVIVNKVPLPGETAYDVSIQPKQKGTPTFDLPGGFTVRIPYINPLTSDTHGAPEAEATIRGMWFGTKKGKVYVGDQNCKVTSWTMNPTTGESEIVFEVHKKIGAGSYSLEVENKVGRSLSFGFTVP